MGVRPRWLAAGGPPNPPARPAHHPSESSPVSVSASSPPQVGATTAPDKRVAVDVNSGDREVTARYDPEQASCATWSALVQSGWLSGDERGEVVERGGPPGLGVVAAGGVGPVAERHPRLGAVVVEFHARDRRLVHSHLWHGVRA
jgi:hypothetical protein